MEKQLNCPRCGGAMQPGFIADRGSYNAPAVSQWVEGEPKRSIWTGLDLKNREIMPVTTYRCETCGYLESYAHAAPVRG